MEKKWLGVINGKRLWALNGKEMTLGYKWKTSLGQELWALDRKEITQGHKWKLTLG